MSRDWHHEKIAGGIAIGESSYHSRRVVMINPTARQEFARWGLRRTGHDGNSSPSFVLWFGTCGTTYLHVYADSLESALEECAAYLAEHAPGHVMPYAGEEHTTLLREACEEHGVAFDPDRFHGVIDSEADEILQFAEADLTYTESGFLTSYEWGISLENPTTAQLYAFIQGE